MIEIKVDSTPSASYDVVLNGRNVTLETQYSSYSDSWSIHLRDPSVTPPKPIVLGIRIVMGLDLLSPYGLDLGVLRAIASDRPGDDPKLADLGTRVQLVHGTAEEFAALAEAS